MSCVFSTPCWSQGLFGGATAIRDTTQAASDSLLADSLQAPRYQKRGYDHRQQVIVGGVVMLCVALALVGMNNYNPRR